jgi:phosphate transport system permease protein
MSITAAPEPTEMPEGKTRAGSARRRDKQTRRSVLIADKAADLIIRVGGILVIAAVFGIMAFLADVVVPLFTGGRIDAETSFKLPDKRGRTLYERIDDYHTLSIAVTDTGAVSAFHVATGAPVGAPAFDFGDRKVTAFAASPSGNDIVFGLDDGTIRVGTLKFAIAVLTPDQVPAGVRALGRQDRTDGDRTDGTAVYAPIAGGQIRRIAIETGLAGAQKIAADGAAIIALDYRTGGTVERPTRAFVTVDAAGQARLSRTESRMNLLTRQMRTEVATSVLPPLPAGVQVQTVLMTDKADQIYAGTRDGRILRYDTRDFDKPELAETARPLAAGVELTQLAFLIGEQSLVVGGSDGTVDVYFRIPREGARTTDGFALVRAHRLEPHGAAVAALRASQRGKLLVTADSRGEVWLRHSTSEQVLLRMPAPAGPVPYETVVLAPRDDGVLALAPDGAGRFWRVAVPHPETTWKSIFGKVWYEGYPEPSYTWQSSSGTDSFEPKLSLVPLIFGTLKATIYSLLFAVPVALLAAIYTSEFLHRRVRAAVKPVMEMMASLPSVVLGFIAALILAPVVETWIAAVLIAFFAIPLALVAAAYLWQLLPPHSARQLDGIPKLLLFFIVIAAAAVAIAWFAPDVERVFFAGDLKAWANGTTGSGVPFLTLLLTPVCLVLVSIGAGRTIGGRVQLALRALPPRAAALADLSRALAYLAGAVLLAYSIAKLTALFGGDVRGGIVDTYVQRNTLVVAFVMGFAVIPIIYTIAEDALNAVPEHLRAASLACGATPWQTAILVILPTAMSGVFAGVMIGMGRAVGETMIVVMAAGNTPILDWNLFNGLRALSANIAVELPEAVKDGTLFRMLFLAALALFVMTFVVNTLAEVIRLRFRKRTAQL